MQNYQKQFVQWYPGHMYKTKKEIQSSLKLVDCVVEVLDARAPFSSSNPQLGSIIKNKPCIILLNKADMANDRATSLWKKHFEKRGCITIAADMKTGRGVKSFYSACDKLKTEIFGKTEYNLPLKIMVLGIPNTGKSSFINKICDKKSAGVQNKAGFTKNIQWYSSKSNIALLDTPGVLWPKFSPEVGDNLAFIGSIKKEVFDPVTVSLRLLDTLIKTDASVLETRYNITVMPSDDSYSILQKIGKRRGCLVSGGEVDDDRAASIICAEFKNGKLGKISLELPKTEAADNE